MKKRGEFLFAFFLLSLLTLIIFINFVSAKDIGYILILERNANQDILGVFKDMNLSVELIRDSKINSYNLSQYRFLFLDDVRLNNARKKPIYNYPGVIMNSYYGEDWGLTDRDGISQLTSNNPLEVKIVSDGIKQVYTQARLSLTSDFIPYYYLDDENKANLKSVARTYVGDGEFGDVISYAANGTILKNNKKSNKLCFYGIAKTKFWTQDAKNLFLDCINYVGSTCLSDAECPSQQIGGRYCIGKDVYRNIEKFSCINPGTAKSECKDDVIPEKIQACADACVNGNCINFTCHNDAECDDRNRYTEDICLNPNTINSTCIHKPIVCLSNSDCGIDGFVGNVYCQDNNVFRNFQSFSCSNPGTSLSSCSAMINQTQTQACLFGCLNGSCLPGTHDIKISNLRLTDLNDEIVSELIRFNKYKIVFDVTNLGNFTENVSFSGTSECSALSFSGITNNIEPNEEVKKSYTKNASCIAGLYNLTINATLLTAIDKNPFDNVLRKQIRIVNPPCFSDSDCTGGALINNFCFNNSLWSNYSVPSCISGSCGFSFNQVLNQTCLFGCANNSCIIPGCNQSEIIGYWKFDDSSFLGKDFSDAHHGIALGDAIFSSEAKIRGSLDLTSNDNSKKTWIEVPFSNELHFGDEYDDFTLEAWIKPKQESLTCNNFFGNCFRGIMGTWSDAFSSGGFGTGGISFVLENGKIEFWTGYVSSSRLVIGKTKIIAPDVWYYVVLTKSGNLYKIYLNGNKIDAEWCTGNIIGGDCVNPGAVIYVGNYDLTIGTDSTISPLTDRFIGKLDEVAVYNKALSDAEIKEHYNNGLGKAYC